MTSARIALVHTGGTIGSIGRDRLDLAWYLDTDETRSAEELLGALPELERIAEVRPVRYDTALSHALSPTDWLKLGTTVSALVDDPDVDGVVVTHGTNTLEESAYFLWLTTPSTKPVVVCGAMRPWSGLSTDGPANLLNAVRVAADARSADHGVLVAFNDMIFSARDVTKTSTRSLHAFTSPELGPLGYCGSDGHVLYYHRSERIRTSHIPIPSADVTLPRVDILVSYAGADGMFVEAAVEAGARGIVSAGTGSGVPTPAEAAALCMAGEAGVVVCQASRVGGGRVSRGPALRRRGWIAADNLNPWKARVLLTLALTRTKDPDEIQGLFDSC
jgi:L-asparaginase